MDKTIPLPSSPDINPRPEEISAAQAKFDATYITSSEIMRNLDLTRASLMHARNTGKLPPAIEVNDGRLFIWERQTVQPFIENWKQALKFRRGY